MAGRTIVMDDTDEVKIDALRDEQTRVARRERRAAREAADPDDAHASDRRAEKAAYLATKLAEREESERG